MKAARSERAAETGGLPGWLIASTALLAATILVLAVVETNLTAAYLIDDEGEFLSLGGLLFIACAGGYLAWKGRLRPALPLVYPWLLYPIVTQGDQIIDHLSINPMRAICHVLLAAIFATPVAVVVLAVRGAVAPRAGRPSRTRSWMRAVPGLVMMADGRAREGAALLAATLLVMEVWLADQFLGSLMIATLIVMAVGVLIYAAAPEAPASDAPVTARGSERFALAVLVVGVLASFGTYYGYKYQEGAYQGSPSFFMDPSKKALNYQMDAVAVPARPVRMPADPRLVAAALEQNAGVIERLLAGYHLLARNYTYDFHNELFVRRTPLVPDYRAVGLSIVEDARRMRVEADASTEAARAGLAGDDPLRALLDEMQAYVAFNFDRAPLLEDLSAGFEATKAGLQHAAHLYEGEEKYLGVALNGILAKHARVVDSPELAPVMATFVATSRRVYELNADRVVGF